MKIKSSSSKIALSSGRGGSSFISSKSGGGSRGFGSGTLFGFGGSREGLNRKKDTPKKDTPAPARRR